MAHGRLHDFLGLHEVGTPAFLKAMFSEFLGTLLLIVAGCGGCMSLTQGGAVPQIQAAVLFGLVVAWIVWTLNHASGAHINPVVSLSFLVTGRLTLVKCIVFTITQCAGAIAGAAILYFMIPESWRGTIASTVFHPDVTLWQGFCIEAVSTFFLLLGVFASGDAHRDDQAGSVPLTIGLVVFVQSAWAGTLTGCSMNPARTLGPALISGTWDHHWVYWVAPSVGAVCGALLYKHVLAATPARIVDQLVVTSQPEVKDESLQKTNINNNIKEYLTEGQEKGNVNLAAELNDSEVNKSGDKNTGQNTPM